jgi:hypothetical protein
MRRFFAGLIASALLLSAPAAFADNQMYWLNYSGPAPWPTSAWTPVSPINPLPITGSFSATGFPGTTQTTGTPISVTTGGVTGTLPTGAVVVASNVGATNGAYCKLGASATTSDQLIPPNSWFAFTVGANTQLTCITSTSTTTVNMVGGSGLPTGSGGGGGGSGGGGAITAASGSYASGALSSGSVASGAFASGSISNGADVAEGTTTDAVCTTPASGTACTMIALAKAINNNVASAIPAGTNSIGSVNLAANVTATDCSGTVVTGGTAVNAFTAQTTLHGFTIANYDTSHNDEVLWISFTTTAAASTAGSYPLPAPTATSFAGFGSFTAPPGFGLNHALSVVAATSGHAFSCTWW